LGYPHSACLCFYQFIYRLVTHCAFMLSATYNIWLDLLGLLWWGCTGHSSVISCTSIAFLLPTRSVVHVAI
jgi:hypothetical protein